MLLITEFNQNTNPDLHNDNNRTTWSQTKEVPAETISQGQRDVKTTITEENNNHNNNKCLQWGHTVGGARRTRGRTCTAATGCDWAIWSRRRQAAPTWAAMRYRSVSANLITKHYFKKVFQLNLSGINRKYSIIQNLGTKNLNEILKRINETPIHIWAWNPNFQIYLRWNPDSRGDLLAA